MQGYTFDPASKEGFFGKDQYSFTKGNPREIVTDTAIIAQQCAFIEDIHRRGAEVLLSCHPGIPMDSTQVVELALFLEKRNPDIIKIVTVATSEEELLESFTLENGFVIAGFAGLGAHLAYEVFLEFRKELIEIKVIDILADPVMAAALNTSVAVCSAC